MIERDDDCDALWVRRSSIQKSGTYVGWISWYLYSCHRPGAGTNPTPLGAWLETIRKGPFIIEDNDD